MTSSSTSSRVTLSEFIYGTAWKKDETRRLVKEALVAGFRKVDTAAQPKHYQEDLVGDGLREAYAEGIVRREDLIVQTKFTQPRGQDLNKMPYNPTAPMDVQIKTSIASSLHNLRHETESSNSSYIDALLLHSPFPTIDENLQAWKLLESYVPHQIRTLGISNVTFPILQAIYDNSTIKPTMVSNRFYADTRYDVPLRAFCREHGIAYQSFWTLTCNPDLVRSAPVDGLMKAVNVQRAGAFYALVSALDIEILNGTTSKKHMRDDLDDVKKVQEWASQNADQWAGMTDAFRQLIGDDRA